ncbi:hypothetical protein [Psychrilyobacter atlanticus]|uniref:hypothetical protein n=1 Tax=Psychrilyobacter atlanticus TaxID=271091 RepID=UPI0003F57603|nr:hypothetical protein [Psychrilyobacter atlanticus]
MGIELDLIFRLRYELIKNKKLKLKNDKKEIDCLHDLLDELEKRMKNLLEK